MSDRFQLVSNYQPSGDQPTAIAQLLEGLEDGLAKQTLLGVTGSGKTFTMANVIARAQRPALILAPNKTLAAQLYGEMREFFPHNAVEYFVSYYDYYQPEAYVPASDTFIEKDASINEHIEQMRLSATKAILERRDTIVVASVSSIYGLGDPSQYRQMRLHLSRGETIDPHDVFSHLAELQYTRNDIQLLRGTFRVKGDVIDIMPAESDWYAVRLELFDDTIENIRYFDPLTGEMHEAVPRITIYPKTHYATPRATVLNTIEQIKAELRERVAALTAQNKLVEAQRLEQRTRFDLEMMVELGYCSGIENYSRYLSGREAACIEAIARAKKRSLITAPACRRRWITARSDSKNSKHSPRKPSTYPPPPATTNASTAARPSNKSCARPACSTPKSKSARWTARWKTSSAKSASASPPTSASSSPRSPKKWRKTSPTT